MNSVPPDCLTAANSVRACLENNFFILGQRILCQSCHPVADHICSRIVHAILTQFDLLQEGQHVIGDAYDHVVVMFSDIVGFSTMSSAMSAVEVFLMLTNLYYAFDRLVDKFGVYKVETIGDGYMIAAGKQTAALQ